MFKFLLTIGLGIPGDDEDIIENLTKNKILSRETKEKLKAMKGFRNIPVHRYGRIDDNIIYEILEENLPDFYAFIEEIENFLDN
ncbi:hypothetical protein BEH94_10785 [Candidatus Altiarchaeales archaeon WOR_SM1_SCG]|nr:hypothetical protein BEH94_10785 [Candidatus Altiarchaeales archaeon WOR_SM1_SCG]